MCVVEKHRVPVGFPIAWSQFPGDLFYGDPPWADEVAGRYPRVPIILTETGRSITRYFKPETDARTAAKAVSTSRGRANSLSTAAVMIPSVPSAPMNSCLMS